MERKLQCVKIGRHRTDYSPHEFLKLHLKIKAKIITPGAVCLTYTEDIL